MSLILIVLIAITLGLPVLAMVALAMIGAFDPGLLMTFTTGAVLFGLMTGAVMEIRRIAGLDGPTHLTGAEEAAFDAPTIPTDYDASRLLPEASTSDGRGDEIRVPERIVIEAGALDATGAEPIVVQPQSASGPETDFHDFISAALKKGAVEQVLSAGAKPKRKCNLSKRSSTV